jgi:soluble lytic murein transglycosylase
VLLARALDRIDARDSSRAMYSHAAALVPRAAEWLRLRAAGVASDSAARASYYAGVRSPVARERIARTEAVARERTGDIAGAIRAYEALGHTAAALRLRAATVTDEAERTTIRRELAALVSNRPGSADARTAMEVLDESFAPLSPTEELSVGRSAFRTGPASRAATAYERALAAGLGTPRDRFNHATLLSRMGRDRDAARQFARVTTPRSLAGDAAYQRARSLLRAGEGDVRGALREVLRRFADDTSAASIALLLLADLATDEQRDAPARAAYRDLVETYPSSAHAPRAWFHGALIAYTTGDHRTAAREWDSLRVGRPRSSEATPATYWAGRAWARAGDSARANGRWRAVLEREPQSYYAVLAARRLGVSPWSPLAAPASAPAGASAGDGANGASGRGGASDGVGSGVSDSVSRGVSGDPGRGDTAGSRDSADLDPALRPDLDSSLARIDLLERLGMDFEAGLEYDALMEDSNGSTERLLALGAALRERGQSSRAIRIGTRLVNQGVTDERAYRLMYPVIHGEALEADARERELDPALVAALIRQESWFEPRATSPAGARGLMQVMPSVGAQIARALDYPVWDAALLYQPDVNVELGTTHLADLFRTYDRVEHILAAYNAGGTRVERWRTKRGVDDPEVFTERIPFVETRDYVRIVLRNRELYRALYGW